MLPPFIIDQIRRREEEARRKSEKQQQLDLPIDDYLRPPEPRAEEDDGVGSVVILDLGEPEVP
jgi:hypothetical protein